MPDEKWFFVELRCGGCGLVFVRSKEAVQDKVAKEYEQIFAIKGPQHFQQCKNKCNRGILQKDGSYLAGPPHFGNMNQQILRVEVSAEDLNAGRTF